MKIFGKVINTKEFDIPGTNTFLPAGSMGIIMRPVSETGRVYVEFEDIKGKLYGIGRRNLELVSAGR